MWTATKISSDKVWNPHASFLGELNENEIKIIILRQRRNDDHEIDAQKKQQQQPQQKNIDIRSERSLLIAVHE